MAIAIESATTLLLVYDVPTSVAFYRDVLGFEVAMTSTPLTGEKDDFGWCMLRRGSVELMLNNAYENNMRPDGPDASRAAVHRDTVLYFGCRDLDAARACLLSHGIAAPEPHVTWYDMRQMSIHDPDGYGICFQWPA